MLNGRGLRICDCCKAASPHSGTPTDWLFVRLIQVGGFKSLVYCPICKLGVKFPGVKGQPVEKCDTSLTHPSKGKQTITSQHRVIA